MTAYYAFNKEIADRYGLSAAILLQYIHYWCKKNEEEGRNIIDGCAWTYNTIPAIVEQIACLSEYQVRSATKKLVDAGLIVVGNFNRTKADKMKWYAVTDIAKSILEPKEDSEKESSESVSKDEKNGQKESQLKKPQMELKKPQMELKKPQMELKKPQMYSNTILYNNNIQYNTSNKYINNSASPTPSNRAVDEPTSPTAKSDAHAQARTQGNCPFFDILKAYQSICTSYPSVSILDGDRRKAVIKLWKRYGNLTFFTRAFEKAQASAYLKGTNDRKWHADFDWIVKESNFAKILDGRFDVLYERKQNTPSNRLECASFSTDDINAVMQRAYDRAYGG